MTEALEDTAAGIRQQALALTFHAAFHQARAAYLSGEWQELGYGSFRNYIDATRGPVQITLDPDQRRELVAELSASGVPVTDQAALLGVHRDTIYDDKAVGNPTAKPTPAQVKPQPGVGNPTTDDHEPDIDADPPPPEPTPAQRKAQEARERQRMQDESDGRDASRVGKFLQGWITVETLASNPRRDFILAKLPDSQRERLAQIAEAISWAI